jgi:hypothetical protein
MILSHISQGEAMRVADLKGETLDLWVAKAEGYKLVSDPEEIGRATFGETAPVIFRNNEGRLAVTGADLHGLWSPSKYWAHGGPIIERAEIMICKDGLDVWGAMCGGIWHPNDESSIAQGGQQGTTPLIAAMRAYVASKFGDEVEDIDAPLVRAD